MVIFLYIKVSYFTENIHLYKADAEIAYCPTNSNLWTLSLFLLESHMATASQLLQYTTFPSTDQPCNDTQGCLSVDGVPGERLGHSSGNSILKQNEAADLRTRELNQTVCSNPRRQEAYCLALKHLIKQPPTCPTSLLWQGKFEGPISSSISLVTGDWLALVTTSEATLKNLPVLFAFPYYWPSCHPSPDAQTSG